MKEEIKNKLIPFQGKWVSWELYKDIHKIDEFGYIGDMINGDSVSLPKYQEYFFKEVQNALHKYFYVKLNL